MSTESLSADALHHHFRVMSGRDRQQAHRGATPLELLFDLTFVIAFGQAASQLAHALVTLAPAVTVVGYEVRGYRHQAVSLAS